MRKALRVAFKIVGVPSEGSTVHPEHHHRCLQAVQEEGGSDVESGSGDSVSDQQEGI